MERETWRGQWAIHLQFGPLVFIFCPRAASLGEELLGRGRMQDDQSCPCCIIVHPGKEAVPRAGPQDPCCLTRATLAGVRRKGEPWTGIVSRALCLGHAALFPQIIPGLVLSGLCNICSCPWLAHVPPSCQTPGGHDPSHRDLNFGIGLKVLNNDKVSPF